MRKIKTGVLLINLGTPDAPTVPAVRKYLREFLSDPRVIDINPIGRWLLVNLIIAPFRAPKSTKEYKKLWTPEGSPLLIHGLNLKNELQKVLPENFTVHFTMRYQNPGMPAVLEEMRKANYDQIILFPLFPQYASSTTGSALEKAMGIISKWWVIPEIKMVQQYYDDAQMIKVYAENARKLGVEKFDHYLFSFHGVPERQVDKVYANESLCKDHHCEERIDEDNKFCYKATCYETARLIAAELNLPKDKFTVAFQSRLGRDPWLEPYADQTVKALAKNGVKNLMVFSPAFVADCLETTVEIGEAYQELFQEHGGDKLQLVESLNVNPAWVNCIKDLVLSKAAQ